MHPHPQQGCQSHDQEASVLQARSALREVSRGVGGPAVEPLRNVGVHQAWPGKDWTLRGPHALRLEVIRRSGRAGLGYEGSTVECIPRVIKVQD